MVDALERYSTASNPHLVLLIVALTALLALQLIPPALTRGL